MELMREKKDKAWLEAVSRFPWEECVAVYHKMGWELGYPGKLPDVETLKKYAADLYRSAVLHGVCSTARLTVRVNHEMVELTFEPFGQRWMIG